MTCARDAGDLRAIRGTDLQSVRLTRSLTDEFQSVLPKPVRIIPVIDLMGGQVVRGVAGRRSEYRPIESRLCLGSEPRRIAAAFAELGFKLAYLADLDAIGGTAPAWEIYARVMETGLDLWVDAGVASVDGARRLAEYDSGKLSAIVLGMETIPNPNALGEIVTAIGAERVVFSLDLARGQVLGGEAWRDFSPTVCADIAVEFGVTRFIVLDLAAVGVGRGVPTLELCRRIRERHPQIELVAGGGVRGQADLDGLAEVGCDAALVASALHDGTLP